MKTLLKNDLDPESFEYYINHDFGFDEGTFVSLWKLKPPTNPVAECQKKQRAWIEYGLRCPATGDLLVECMGSYINHDQAWLDFSELTADIIRGRVAIIAEPMMGAESDMYEAVLECY